MSSDQPAPAPAVEISHGTWGAWPSVIFSTRAVEVEVVGEIGARVVSLRDRRRGREWLVAGGPPAEMEHMAWAEEGVVFGGRESFGWDECLPTTSVCPDPLDPGGPALRDHGDQWGRGAYLSIDHVNGAVEHTWSVPRWPYRLSRRLSFADEETVLAEYVLSSLAEGPLPIHWAMHPVLRLEPGSYVDLPEVQRATRTWQHGIDLAPELDWPVATTSDQHDVNLACIDPAAGWSAVLYVEPSEWVRAVAPDGARLDLEWDRDFAPILRVWLSHGGWPPEGQPRQQVALEPCTSATDDLEGALASGQARMLPPAGELHWWARLRLS